MGRLGGEKIPQGQLYDRYADNGNSRIQKNRLIKIVENTTKF